MPAMSHQELMDLIKRNAELYSSKSTKLSNLLEQAEKFLADLPGKFSVTVGNGPEYLSFERKTSNSWGLVYGDVEQESQDVVTNASVEIKARAAVLLPELVDKLLVEHDNRLNQVELGLKSLEKISFLNCFAEPEGE